MASLDIEYEAGTCTGWVHPHNGYYAGDFSEVPMSTPRQIAALAQLRLPTFQDCPR